jgi:hypothetical protein
MEMNYHPDLKPLGAFAILHLAKQPQRARSVLEALRGGLKEDPKLVAAYLRSGTVLLAIMEQTSDLVGTRFSVAGGSGILTDGTFFWRADAANYVEHYLVSLPHEFIARGRELGWSPKTLTRQQAADADRQVSDFYRASLDEGLWADDEQNARPFSEDE